MILFLRFSLHLRFDRDRWHIEHSRQCLTTPNNVKFAKQYSATRHIFNSSLGVWRCGQTRPFFDMHDHTLALSTSETVW